MHQILIAEWNLIAMTTEKKKKSLLFGHQKFDLILCQGCKSRTVLAGTYRFREKLIY